MAKHRRTAQPQSQSRTEKTTEGPKLSWMAFQVATWITAAGLVAQLIMAAKVYSSLPSRIPASWAGSTIPYNTVPSWYVFIVFPGAQLALLALAMFSPRDADGRRAVEISSAVSRILLALLFTSLQLSAFFISG